MRITYWLDDGCFRGGNGFFTAFHDTSLVALRFFFRSRGFESMFSEQEGAF
jgi:hypothetical protein